MKWLTSLSINRKMIGVMIMTLLIFSLLVALLFWNTLETSLAEQYEERGIEIAARLASLCADPILFNDPFALYEIANDVLINSEDVRYVLVMDHTGQVLAHTFASGLPYGLADVHGDLADQATEIKTIDTNEGIMLDIQSPVGEGRIGYVRLGLSENHIRSLIQEKLNAILLITLLVCVLAVIMSAVLTTGITKPLTLLAKATQEIARGNLQSRVEVRANDEIGQLTTAFNKMADSLIISSNEKDALLTALQDKEQMRDILLNKLITAQEDERKRISRELHDETSQALTSLLVAMRLLADDTSDPAMQNIIRGIRDMTVKILTDLRNLAVELRPPVLDDLGLIAAIQKYLDQYQARYGIQTEFAAEPCDCEPDSQTALTLYRILQECLTNVARHSAASLAKISLAAEEGWLLLQIKDNGRGIRPEDLEKARSENRIGMYGMQERAELLGGTFGMSSDHTGTTIMISLPCRGQLEGEVLDQ